MVPAADPFLVDVTAGRGLLDLVVLAAAGAGEVGDRADHGPRCPHRVSGARRARRDARRTISKRRHSSLDRARGEAGDVMLDEERIDDRDRDRAQQGCCHQLSQ